HRCGPPRSEWPSKTCRRFEPRRSRRVRRLVRFHEVLQSSSSSSVPVRYVRLTVSVQLRLRLDRLAFVDRSVAVRHLIEVHGAVEDPANCCIASLTHDVGCTKLFRECNPVRMTTKHYNLLGSETPRSANATQSDCTNSND